MQGLISLIALNDHVVGGGPGAAVETDESKFGKRKCHKGHRVEGAWVFGGVELMHEQKSFVVVAPDRKKATLMAIIKRHIAPGSVVRSDCWTFCINLKSGTVPEDFKDLPGFIPEGCKGLADWLPEMNHTREVVNHERHFKDPLTGVHTNTIERTWFAVKRTIPVGKRPEKHLQGCLFEFVWCQRNESNLWNGLMRALEEASCEADDPIAVALKTFLGDVTSSGEFPDVASVPLAVASLPPDSPTALPWDSMGCFLSLLQ